MIKERRQREWGVCHTKQLDIGYVAVYRKSCGGVQDDRSMYATSVTRHTGERGDTRYMTHDTQEGDGWE